MDGDQFPLSIYLMTRSQRLCHQQAKRPIGSCGNNPDKLIIKQEFDSANILLNEDELHASLEPFDENGRLALIISLKAER